MFIQPSTIPIVARESPVKVPPLMAILCFAVLPIIIAGIAQTIGQRMKLAIPRIKEVMALSSFLGGV